MSKRWFYFLIICCIVMAGRASAQSPRFVIDSLLVVLQKPIASAKQIPVWFALADNYMEENQYDSAQIWLNQISSVLPLKTPSIDNYFLSTRQAEVYYYNGLQRLGLQESERSLSIAQALNDSLLLADSYNFIGLFYINLDSLRKAIPYFKTGIRYVRQPPYPPRYLSLTKPHHLYGNLAEAYEKLKLYDSAIYLSHISHQLATAIQWHRGIAVARYNLGSCYYKRGQLDSAQFYFSACVLEARLGKDFDVELIGYGGLANTADANGNPTAARDWLAQGLALMKEKRFVNPLFKSNFLDEATVLYEKYGALNLLIATLKNKADVLEQQFQSNNRQINLILNAGLQNETRLLNLQIREGQQQNEIIRTRLWLIVLVFILFLGGFFLYRSRLKQQLALVKLQNKISQDLHDDVGSSLSSLQVYSTVADKLLESQPVKAREMLQKITRESTAVMENIGDIVWSMKPGADQGLQERIKNFVADVLGAANIHYQIEVDDSLDESIRNMEARRNMLLIIKEAVNNVIKYSKAQHVQVSVRRVSQQVCMEVTDDGIGFVIHETRKGNGLSNMQKRTVEMGGQWHVVSQPGKGCRVSAFIPLTKISDNG